MTPQSLHEKIGCNSPKIHWKKWLRLGLPKRKYLPNSCSCTPPFFSACAFLPIFFGKTLVVGIFPRLAPARAARTFWMSSYITGSEPSNFRQRWTFMGFSSSSDSARTWRLRHVDPSNRTETEGVWGRRPSWRVVWHTVMMIVSEWLQETMRFFNCKFPLDRICSSSKWVVFGFINGGNYMRYLGWSSKKGGWVQTTGKEITWNKNKKERSERVAAKMFVTAGC